MSHTWVSLSPPIIKGLSAFQVQLILQLLLACSKHTSVQFFSGAESWFVARRLISHVSAHCAAWNPRSGWSSVVVACMRHLSWHPFFAYGFDAFSCCAAGEVVRCVLVRSVWKRLAPVRLQSLSGAPLAPSCRLPCCVLVSRCSLPGVAGTGTQSLSARAQPP